MAFPRVKTDTKTAFNMYYKNTYLTKKDIKEMFSCSPATATKIANIARYEMKENNIRLLCDNPYIVDKDTVFRIAGLDIKAITKQYYILIKAEARMNK